jgi:hypothetical protein
MTALIVFGRSTSPIEGEGTTLSGGQRAEILPLRPQLLLNRLVRVKQQRIL